MFPRLKTYLYRRFKTSFSKSGEDIQLWQLLKKSQGTYIDIGGHHPVFSSNSYFFYIRGWQGIVVEPNPKFEILHKKIRPNDFFFSGGVAGEEGEMEYLMLSNDERNSFSGNHLENSNLIDQLTSKKSITVRTLSQICSQFLGNNPAIDFMTIDVEGMEREVLLSNDWKKYRPKYILLESHLPIEKEINGELCAIMNDKEYHLIGKTLQGQFLGTLWFRANEVEFR